jgi:hypothetical protein
MSCDLVDVVDFQGVCSALGVVLTLAMVVPVCWILADMLLIARFLIQPPPKPNFVAYLYVLGWSELCNQPA